MPITLNDIIDLSAQQEFDPAVIEAYGCRMGACINADITINRQTEYVLQIGGKIKRVFNWEQSGGNSRMYIKEDGERYFLPEDAVTMLTHGKPSYDKLTLVAQQIKEYGF